MTLKAMSVSDDFFITYRFPIGDELHIIYGNEYFLNWKSTCKRSNHYYFSHDTK